MALEQATESDPTWEDVVAAYAEAALDRRDGSIIALIESYDSARQLAEVRAVVPVKDQVTGILLNPIFTVRVAWPRAGGSGGAQLFADTMPLTRGDPMRVMPQDRDHSGWFASGTTGVEPRGKHRSQLVDAVAVPGGASDVDPLPAAAVAVDGRVIYGDPFVYLGSSLATEFVALATKVLTELQAIKAHVDGLTVSPGSFTTPSGPVTGVSGPPLVAMPAPSSVASTVVKSI
jgi:hypothetical protein